MRVLVTSLGSILLLAWPSPVPGQTTTVDLERVRTALLKEVRVTITSGERLMGVLQSADNETFTVLTANGTVALPPAGVRKIERPGDSVKNGFIIGALVGIAYGAVMYSIFRDETENPAAAFAVGTGMFGLIGAGIDALHKGWTTVYRTRDGG